MTPQIKNGEYRGNYKIMQEMELNGCIYKPWNLAFLFLFFFNFFCLFAISRATLSAYGDSQAKGQIRAVATSLRQSHSNIKSKPCL